MEGQFRFQPVQNALDYFQWYAFFWVVLCFHTLFFFLEQMLECDSYVRPIVTREYNAR